MLEERAIHVLLDPEIEPLPFIVQLLKVFRKLIALHHLKRKYISVSIDVNCINLCIVRKHELNNEITEGREKQENIEQVASQVGMKKPEKMSRRRQTYLGATKTLRLLSDNF